MNFHQGMHLFLTVVFPSIYTTYALQCYTSYETRNNTCSNINHHIFFNTAEECCHWPSAQAYSIETPTENDSVLCMLCKHTKVHCYQTVYWGRTCHEHHNDMSTIEECCLVRGLMKNHTTLGYYFQQVVVNESVPTYTCTPCEDVVEHATWTSWSTCNASCAGGYKTRVRKCQASSFSQKRLCYGEAVEVKSCNENPCLSPIVTVLIIIVSLFAIMFILLVLHKCYRKRKFPSLESAITTKRTSIELSATTNLPRYETVPDKKRRSLPFPPIDAGCQPSIYEDVCDNEDSTYYLPMSKQIIK